MSNESLILSKIVHHCAGLMSLAQFQRVAAALGLFRPCSASNLAGVLQEEAGNVSAAARRLGVCTKTLYRLADRSGLQVSSFRGPS